MFWVQILQGQFLLQNSVEDICWASIRAGSWTPVLMLNQSADFDSLHDYNNKQTCNFKTTAELEEIGINAAAELGLSKLISSKIVCALLCEPLFEGVYLFIFVDSVFFNIRLIMLEALDFCTC